MNPQQIREQFVAFQRSRILLTAFELEIFTLLDKGSQTSKSISTTLKADHRATDHLLNALCALGFLNKNNGEFSNKDFAAEHLVKEKPGFMSGLYHVVHLWESWSGMTDVIRTGSPANIKAIDDRGAKWLNAFIESMHNRAQQQAKASVEGLNLKNVVKVLDVGGGSAAFTMAFIRAREDIRATVFELPNVVPITQKYIEKAGFVGKIDTYEGNYYTDELPRGYDLVFLSAIVHANSYKENEELINKCAKALNPGGQLVIQDFIMEDDRTKPIHGAIFALNMLTGTETGDTYTESEIKEWMTKAGLSDFKRLDQPFGTGQIIGVK